MKLDNDFYKEVLRVANDEVDRLKSLYDLSEKSCQEIYVQAISAATMICYHNELVAELSKHGIEIEELDHIDEE